uniref:Transposase-associated domain-containing protein n=1 Tax=Ananas comosus var. bracteatus TaxID=296719 RepID=A0A6V7NY73_ANACO|nr:unnamed protein product [Ananas comosus var. bracteatus]
MALFEIYYFDISTHIHLNKYRVSKKYLDGVLNFLDFAFLKAVREGSILCPCKRCANCFWQNKDTVLEHLICDGFLEGYTSWIYHGEDITSPSSTYNYDNLNTNDDMRGMLNEAFGMFDVVEEEIATQEQDLNEDPNEEAKKFYKLVGDSEKELYPGCKKFSKLFFYCSFISHKVSKWMDQ